MATKKPFIARHGINVGSTVVFGSNGKLHANNVISNGTITDDMLAGSTGSNLSKVQQVESNLLATNTAIRALVTSNDTDISNLQTEDSNLWSSITATNTAIRALVTSNDTDISSLWSSITSTNTAIRSYVDTEVAGLVDSAPAALDTLNELAAALGDDANFAATVSTNIGQKLGATASITLSGDVSGSGSFSSNSVNISVTVADDSHNHTISNVDGLQDALDAKAATSSLGSLATLSTVNAATITDNSVGAAELNVSGNGTAGQYLQSDGDGTMTWATVATPTLASLNLDTDDNVRFNSFGVGTGASGTAGQIRATNSIVAYYSDDRLKTRQGNIENAVEKVMSLNGFYYTENETAKSLGYDNDNVQVGVSAQEVEAILPEIIEDAPINANFEGADYKTLMYDKLVPLLVEAIKEQQNQIDELKGIINNQ